MKQLKALLVAALLFAATPVMAAQPNVADMLALQNEAAVFIEELTDYERPPAFPFLAFTSKELIVKVMGERRAVSGYISAKEGNFPDGVILLDTTMKFATNLCAQSIVIHEMAHAYQEYNDAYPVSELIADEAMQDRMLFLSPEVQAMTGRTEYFTLLRKHLWEAEAYNLQKRWLVRKGIVMIIRDGIDTRRLYNESCELWSN